MAAAAARSPTRERPCLATTTRSYHQPGPHLRLLRSTLRHVASLALRNAWRVSCGAFFNLLDLLGGRVQMLSDLPGPYNLGFHTRHDARRRGGRRAKLLKLNDVQLGHMLSMRRPRGGPLQLRPMTKPFHVGARRRDGVIAAELAARGFTGVREGGAGSGLLQVLGGGADLDRIVPVIASRQDHHPACRSNRIRPASQHRAGAILGEVDHISSRSRSGPCLGRARHS